MRLWFIAVLFLTSSMILSGCELLGKFGNNVETPSTSGTARETQNNESPPELRDDHNMVPKPGIKPDPSGHKIDARSLVGKNEAEAVDVLGPPNAIRKVATATIWRYQAGGCALDLFFYMDLGTNSFRALDYEFKALQPGNGKPLSSTCNELVKRISDAGRN